MVARALAVRLAEQYTHPRVLSETGGDMPGDMRFIGQDDVETQVFDWGTLKWLADGAMPTDSARSLLSQTGIWQEFRGERATSPGSDSRVAAPESTVEAPDERSEQAEETTGE